MATNGNRWLKERGGKNPLSRMMEQRGPGPMDAPIEVGAPWIHKVTGLRFSVEVFEDETVLLAPVEQDAAPIEVSVEQFRSDFVQAHAFKAPSTNKSSNKRRRAGGMRHKRRGGARARR